MSAANEDELQTVDPADLTRVKGGAGDDFSGMLPMLAIAMRNRTAAAGPAQAPAVPPWQPTITVDGVPQQLSQTGSGTFTTSTG